jgi:L-cysteine:1D-myo-inositol 2-amino-2-deoxy-alpha-D-glucopyranoside ligase
LVGLDGTKMSKSLGNLVFVGELLKDWEPAAVRLALLDHHYRPDWEWTAEDMPRAARRLEAWGSAPRVAASGSTAEGDANGEADEDLGLSLVRQRLDDDLDTPGALGALDDQAASGRPVVRGAALLGVTL